MQQIEFVDFIFDRYAYLEIPQTSSQPEIESRIKQLRAQNHPDRLTNLGNDLKAQAAQNWQDLEKCAEVLLNNELRPLYDQRLAQFQKERPRHIVKNSRWHNQGNQSNLWLHRT